MFFIPLKIENVLNINSFIKRYYFIIYRGNNMNLPILSLIILTTIASPGGGFGILLGIAFIYFILSNEYEKENIKHKFKTWSWWNWRV